MIIKMKDNLLRIKREKDESTVFSRAAFFHRLKMELQKKDIHCKSKYDNRTKTTHLIGELDKQLWAISEDIGVNAKEMYNSNKPVVCFLYSSVRTMQEIRRRIKNGNEGA